MKLQGVFAATVAPMDKSGQLLENELSDHARRLLDTGVDGLLANGHTGEILGLDPEERQHVVRTVREVAGTDVLVLGGVHGQSTRDAQRQAQAAAQAGADAAVIFSPFVFSRGAFDYPEAILGFYRGVIDAAGIPIVIMQYPPHSGLCIPERVLADAVALDGVIGVKQAVGDIALYERNLLTIRESDPDAAVLTASEGALFPSYAVGCDGSLIGFANLPEPILDLHRAFQSGDLDRARAANDRLRPLSRAIYSLPSYRWSARLKYALHALGWISTPTVRPPLLEATETERQAIEQALDSVALQGAV